MNKNIKFFYYSGSGNTGKILEESIKVFKKSEYKVNAIEINNKTMPEVENSEIVALFFPINSHSTMPFIWKFIRNLPKAQNNSFFFVYTCNNSAAIAKPLSRKLRQKGYKLLASKEILMPNNLIVKESEIYKERLIVGEKNIIEFSKKFINKEYEQVSKQSGSSFVSFMTRNLSIPWIAMRMFFGFNTNDKCNACGVCIKNCPVDNIKLNKKAVHAKHCEFCLKCISNCPLKAINFKADNIKVNKTEYTIV